MASKIAVLYLARLAEGFAAFEAFAETYRKHPAGELHDLVIICKGFAKPGEHAAIDAIFKGIDYKTISVPEDIGLDIHAYRAAARKIDNEYIVCLNTFSNLRAGNWLAKLWSNMSKPGVGMVGATGSFESLYSSIEAIEFYLWSLRQPARYNEQLNRDFTWLLRHVDPVTMRQKESKRLRIRRMMGDVLRNRPSFSKLQEYLPTVWANAIGHNGGHRYFRDVPQFPNPHIRSNAFMVRRTDLLGAPLPDKSKFACCQFESGIHGLSITALNKGLELLVVGADGVGYPLEQWPTCRAFRSGDQSNLLVSDNQTDAFDRFSKDEKRTHLVMTWGGYDPEIDPHVDVFGVSFGKRQSLRERIKHLAPMAKAPRERLMSIAIPTHNRLDLVLDAIKTVTRQNYENWEILVFDNCSDEPIAPAVNALGDARIRVERSEDFLPVTASWNRAINMAKGEYVTMVGDDDGIAPGYFERINYLADEFDNPDLVFSNLYQFMHPGVVPSIRQGYVASLQMADFLDGDYPFIVDRETIRRSVDNSLRMRRSFMFNMPAFCASRTLLERLRIDGQVLHSPFPDYYFSNLALQLAEKVVAEPRPLAFQGVSKVSFGFTLINNRTDEGFKVLNYDGTIDPLHKECSRHLLPGSRYYSEYIITMAHVANVLDDGRKPDFQHYRKVQIWQYLKDQPSMLKWMKTGKGRELWVLLSPEEKRWALKSNLLYKLSKRFPRYLGSTGREIDRAASDQLRENPQAIYRVGDHVTLSDVYTELEEGPFSPDLRSPEKDSTIRALRAV
ncbi:glycosyltransferase family A protein [Rhizobium leguminosarum]|uniref:glycosyltransferase family A protein n=1 Tax=Rhizobium leguminosarum TaxID=384 RepID=UPI003D084156